MKILIHNYNRYIVTSFRAWFIKILLLITLIACPSLLFPNQVESFVGIEGVIDLKGKTDIADFMIIATGKSSKHVASTAEFVIGKIKENDSPYIVEGQNSDWVLVDTMDIITHIFTKDTRELYDLEQLWQHRK